jgi:hypothetical protein
MKSSIFEIAAGSTPGRDHLFQGGLLIGRNNQDAYAWRTLDGGNTVAAVVCDGCGSHRNSEVGAKIGAELILSAINRRLPTASASLHLPREFWEAVRQDVLADIRILARTMAGSTSVTETLAEYFLFTIVGTIVTPSACWVFSIGDGVVIVDGVLENLGPFPGNAPPYLAYGITGSNIAEHADMLSFKVSMYPALTRGVLIGSDGVGELLSLHDRTIPASTELVGAIDQFWTDGRFFRNQDLVRRRLTRLNGLQIRTEGGAASFVPGLLQDDTTLVVVRPVATDS